MSDPARKAATDTDRQARDWFVALLDENVSQEDLMDWGLWLDADPANRAAYERIADTWDVAAALALPAANPAELAADGYDGAVPVAQWRRRRRARLRLLWPAVATTAIAAIALGLFGLKTSDKVDVQHFATNRGQHVDTRLSDGSTVRLGAMTALEVSFRARRRTLELSRGEALFTVAHDRTRPFVVGTPLGAITAVGTAFNVDVGAHTVILNVTEGVVSVALGASAAAGQDQAESVLRVAAGQRLRMEGEGGRLRVEQSQAVVSPAWIDGRLEYRDEPLRSVIDDVNRYASRPIVLGDPSLGGLSYTGTVRLDATDAWVRGLPAAFPLVVEAGDGDQIVLKEKSTRPLPAKPPQSS